MQRRRQSVPHIFEDQIAAEKARLEAQVADAPPGPQKDALLLAKADTAFQGASVGQPTDFWHRYFG